MQPKLATSSPFCAEPPGDELFGDQPFVLGLTALLPWPPSTAFAEHLVGEHALEPRGLLLQLLELLSLVHLQHAELALPEMEGLLAYLLLQANIQDRLVGSLRFPETADLLPGSVPSIARVLFNGPD